MPVEFVDTNVLVYAHDTSAGGKRRTAADLVLRIARARAGAISIQVLLELFVVVTRKIQRPLNAAQAKEIVSDLSFWRVHAPDLRDVKEALRISEDYRISVWDAMIIQSAIAEGASVLWTEDLNDGQEYAGVLVRNPFATAA